MNDDTMASDEVIIEQEASRMAVGVLPLLRWFDTMLPPKDMDIFKLNYGFVSYWGMMHTQKTAGGVLSVPVKHHRCLMGVLIPGADIHIFKAFPVMLERCALKLGAPDEENTVELALSPNYHGQRTRLRAGAKDIIEPVSWTLSWPEKAEAGG